MAKTTRQNINIKDEGKLWSFPVASGQTIYQGTLAAVCKDGLLYNLTSTYAKQARIIVLVADGSDNATGPAATTSDGSISGTLEEKARRPATKPLGSVISRVIFDCLSQPLRKPTLAKLYSGRTILPLTNR